jgi:hypothetical protein
MAKLMSSADVCRETGATYKQLDSWARAGYATPAVPAKGSGSHRGWSGDDVDQVRRLLIRSADLRAGLGAVGQR